ncbi:hypothetical protein GM418_04110 [Maribellus comscasis]|uniref:Uncharacterized protein n=1 Tax=Maribellus comscasis TaxID=2681766 RepID=A0A6I6JRX6_9BACT|nr:hypothetical protein [Maribellus comscasis]QGY42867.1 hypothetical protein GM418_04110 [Maribellus comscasis]
MSSKLKRDQIPPVEARNWRKNFNEEKEKTFNLVVPRIILEKDTYLKLAGENENRVRIYLALEEEKQNGKNVLCAFAVSAFLLGSGDVYADYETPVFKLEEKNVDYSNNTQAVIDSIRRYRKWRSGEIDAEDAEAKVRQYIYPNAYLLTKFELHEIFITQSQTEAEIDFGVSKVLNTMIYPGIMEEASKNDGSGEVFDVAGLCPPFCDERSIYNT